MALGGRGENNSGAKCSFLSPPLCFVLTRVCRCGGGRERGRLARLWAATSPSASSRALPHTHTHTHTLTHTLSLPPCHVLAPSCPLTHRRTHVCWPYRYAAQWGLGVHDDVGHRLTRLWARQGQGPSPLFVCLEAAGGTGCKIAGRGSAGGEREREREGGRARAWLHHNTHAITHTPISITHDLPSPPLAPAAFPFLGACSSLCPGTCARMNGRREREGGAMSARGTMLCARP